MIGRPSLLQIDPARILASVRFQAMNLEQRGAFGTLALYAWLERVVSSDPSALAVLVRMAPAEFERRIWQHIGGCFADDGGRLVLPELERLRERQRSRSSVARAAAFRRWKAAGE